MPISKLGVGWWNKYLPWKLILKRSFVGTHLKQILVDKLVTGKKIFGHDGQLKMVSNPLKPPSSRGGINLPFHWNWVDCIALLNNRICQANKICASSWALKTGILHFLSLGTLNPGEASQHVRSLLPLDLHSVERPKSATWRDPVEKGYETSPGIRYMNKEDFSWLQIQLSSDGNCMKDPKWTCWSPEPWEIITNSSNWLSFGIACYIAINKQK